MSGRREQIHFRIKAITAFLVFLLVALVARAADLQIFKGDVFRELADRQQRRTLRTAPQRGDIVDREGQELAVSLQVDSAFANPAEISDPRAAAARIARITKQDVRKLAKMLARKGSFVWVARQLEPPVAAALRAAAIPGVGFVKESKRYYPHGPLSGQMLGFVGIDANGLEGLERSYEKYIRGESEVVELQRDALNRGILTEGLGSDMKASGYRVELAIDKGITYEAQKALDAVVLKYKAMNGIAVVEDVDTGAILAMVTSPPFDPNKFDKYPVGYGRNRVVADVYEPGSTIKPFLLAAALQEKVVTPETLIFCENGHYQVADRRVHDTHEHGWLTASQVVKYSSNIGALKIGRMLGKQAWSKYIDAFGFGEVSGVDLPGEAHGLLRPVEKWNEVALANMSYGQGLSITPLQLVNAMATLANGGKLMKPYVVARILDSRGKVVYEAEPVVRGHPILPEIALKVRRSMESVVKDDGTGTQAAVPGYEVAGKTGTAQKIDPATGAYSRAHYLASFAGYLPARDPRVAILVTINEPQGEIYGGIVAAPVFSAIGAKAMERLHVPPDNPVALETEEENSPLPEAVFASVISGETQFAGLTLREALRVARQNSVTILPRGTGRAMRERCGAKGCEVEFKPL